MLENRTEKEISRVVVVELRAGLELQIAAAEFLHEILYWVGVARHFGKELRVVGIAGDTGRMAEQLADGDFRTSILAVVGKIVGEVAVELNGALGHLLHDQH